MDVLLIDDVHRLAKKTVLQEELADTADITDMADTTTDTATDIPTATVKDYASFNGEGR